MFISLDAINILLLRSKASSKAAVLIVLLALLTACKSQSEPAAKDAASTNTIVSSTPPFQTKEPERYQATRTITTTNGEGRTAVYKTAIAKDGDRRRHESETLSKRVVFIDTPEGKFVLLLDHNIYFDLTAEAEARLSEEEEITPEHLLHEDATTTSYQNLGKEAVGGRTTNKYRVIVNSSSSPNVSQSETLIWIDEVWNMPIRSETTTRDGTRIVMEVTNLSLEVDKSLFQLPENYQKVSFGEFQKLLTATE
jgi:outer membrane lipoprotein-sorting protein